MISYIHLSKLLLIFPIHIGSGLSDKTHACHSIGWPLIYVFRIFFWCHFPVVLALFRAFSIYSCLFTPCSAYFYFFFFFIPLFSLVDIPFISPSHLFGESNRFSIGILGPTGNRFVVILCVLRDRYGAHIRHTTYTTNNIWFVWATRALRWYDLIIICIYVEYSRDTHIHSINIHRIITNNNNNKSQSDWLPLWIICVCVVTVLLFIRASVSVDVDAGP